MEPVGQLDTLSKIVFPEGRDKYSADSPEYMLWGAILKQDPWDLNLHLWRQCLRRLNPGGKMTWSL